MCDRLDRAVVCLLAVACSPITVGLHVFGPWLSPLPNMYAEVDQ
ncbi:membrane protein [Gordonia phage Fairfaxidum]|uniref:Uncharacterized protein n=1 Tax=Gordonia phage Fairfaxidum TaxID=2572526 RepID=A0A4D6T6H9_9CAUD|nr:hypothetical protein [Gordonia rubripertincta]YP_009822355.1 membrane protein [Gordonia phage Fairfaxidum]QCG77650.1 hypothetical protein SEA_FAIRFAXIDUM_67 [Gordonia phage Fairfaxidum]